MDNSQEELNMGESIQHSSVTISTKEPEVMKNSTQRSKITSSTKNPEVKEMNYFVIFMFSIMHLLNTILSKNLVWSIILILAVKGVFSKGAAILDSNIQLERPQMNLTTPLSRKRIILQHLN